MSYDGFKTDEDGVLELRLRPLYTDLDLDALDVETRVEDGELVVQLTVPDHQVSSAVTGIISFERRITRGKIN